MRRTFLAVIAVGALVAGCSGNGSGTGAKGGTGASGGAGGTGGGGGSSAVGSGGGGSVDAGTGTGGMGGPGTGGLAVTSNFSWVTLPSLSKARQNPIGVAVGATMYVIGGLDSTGLLTEVETFQPGQTAWAAGPSLPNPQCCAAAGVLGNVIAVAGGYGSDGHTPTNALLLLDTTTGVWQSGPTMPTARANAMGAVWNGKLAVIGGGVQYGATQATGVIEIYDPVAGSWASSTLTVTPRTGGVAIVDSDEIYAIGGTLQNGLNGAPLVEIVTADGVTSGPSLTLGRVQVAGGLMPQGLVVAGGWTTNADTPMAEGLLGAMTAWQSLPPMPTSRAGAAAAVINGSLIVAGGGQYQGNWVPQTAVEELQAN